MKLGLLLNGKRIDKYWGGVVQQNIVKCKSELPEAIEEYAGNQPFIAEGGHFLVFCEDVNRHKQKNL